MSLFIKRTLLFISLFFGVIIFIAVSTSFIENKKSSFKLENNPNYIVIGHSHPETAYNDAIIPRFKNLAQSGESYFYSYIKTKQVIKQNPSINVVFIEFTNNQVDEEMDDWIWGDKYITYRYPTYSSFMNNSENLMLFRNNPLSFTNALSLSIRAKFSRLAKNDDNFTNLIGGYLYLERDKIDSLITHSENQTNELTKKRNISEANLFYLDAIIEQCKKSKIEVILVRSPLHKQFVGHNNEKEYQEILTTRYSEIEYLDFSTFPLLNYGYGDYEHLNHKGAKVFSEWFAKQLNDGLLNKTNKQSYIDEVINNEQTMSLIKDSESEFKSN